MEGIVRKFKQFVAPPEWRIFASSKPFPPSRIATDFLLFPSLPEEIRRHIWRAALGLARVHYF
jgi:hypothetical protein